MRPDPPGHLKAKAYDKRALCGIKDPLPYGLVKWAAEHRYPRERCVECYERAGIDLTQFDGSNEGGGSVGS